MGILDQDDTLQKAFGAVGALPFGGKIRAEIHGTVLADCAYRSSPTTIPSTYLRVERVLKPQKAGP